MDAVHPRAMTGFTNASAYDTHRIECTPECVLYILNLCGFPDGRRKEGYAVQSNVMYDILEIGAGTGKFTGAVQQYLANDIRYLATEPIEGFLRKLQQHHPCVHTEQCAANSIPLPDQSVSSIVIAQAFHWFANEESLDEMWRVLVDGGTLVILWNTRDTKDQAWIKDVDDFITPIYNRQGNPQQQSQKWMAVFENNKKFTKLEASMLPGPVKVAPKNEMLAYYATLSVIQSDADRTDEYLRKIAELLPDGELRLPYYCEIYCCYKVS